MWYRIRTAAFLATSVAVFLAVGVTLAWLLLGYVRALGGAPPGLAALHGLVVAIAAAGTGLAALFLVQVTAHAASRRASAVESRALARWTERWSLAAETGRVPDGARGPSAAEALARLRESVRGEAAARFEHLYERSGLLQADLDAAARGSGLGGIRAIERLAMVRHRAAILPLARLTRSRDPVVSRLARRAAVRTLAAAQGRETDVVDVGVRLLGDARVSAGEATELLLLLGATGTSLLLELLDPDAKRPVRLRIAALEAIGRDDRIDLAGRVDAWARHPDPELRAAALRCYRTLEHVPGGGEAPVLASLSDPVPFVRTQAAGACVALPFPAVERPLWLALGDPDRWVRRTAAATLSAFGAEGRAALERASAGHDDRFARDAAAEALAWR
jgi:hypothetical protein